MKIKIRNFVLLSAFVLALSAAFAFKSAPLSINASIKDPVNSSMCITYMTVDPSCSQYNTGPQCTAYFSTTYPSNPAYVQACGGCKSGSCVIPLYEPFF